VPAGDEAAASQIQQDSNALRGGEEASLLGIRRENVPLEIWVNAYVIIQGRDGAGIYKRTYGRIYQTLGADTALLKTGVEPEARCLGGHCAGQF